VIEVTLSVSVKLAVAPTASELAEQLIVPVPPAGGVAHVQPDDTTMPSNVVRGGTAKVSTGLAAVSGPLLLTEIPAVMFCPAMTGSGDI
jgi:imidazole glycerol phosphate synthase subunit HisF